MDFVERKQLASGTTEMVTANTDKITEPSALYNNEQIRAMQTESVNSSPIAECDDEVQLSSEYLTNLC
jgi:hypothetical protein